MSHYLAHAIVPAPILERHGGDVEKAVEGILAPYREELEVPYYIAATKEERIKERRQIIDRVINSVEYRAFAANEEKYREGNSGITEEEIAYLKNFADESLKDDDELFKGITKFDDFHAAPIPWKELPEDLPTVFTDEHGNEWSCMNPHAEWDWYVIGGRWEGAIKLEDGSTVDSAPMEQVALDSIDAPFTLVTPDGWLSKQKWERGTWNSIPQELWEEIWREHLELLGGSDVLVALDIHI